MQNDFGTGVGCALFLAGALMTLAGVLTLSGVVSVELEFFELDVDTREAQIVWTLGFAAVAVAGYRLFRAGGRGD